MGDVKQSMPPSVSLVGSKVFLRTLEPRDLEYLYRWENDPAVRQYGDCGAERSASTAGEERFSRETLGEFIGNQQYDIYITGQLRFVICRLDAVNTPVGFIDLFDFDPAGLRAGVGILICNHADRRKGYGREALELVSDYARQVLGLHELWSCIAADNRASLALFSGEGFVCADNGNSTQEELLLHKFM